jgi:hypothetical protein
MRLHNEALRAFTSPQGEMLQNLFIETVSYLRTRMHGARGKNNVNPFYADVWSEKYTFLLPNFNYGTIFIVQNVDHS